MPYGEDPHPEAARVAAWWGGYHTALEEAARIAETYPETWTEHHRGCKTRNVPEPAAIAAAIRALKDDPVNHDISCAAYVDAGPCDCGGDPVNVSIGSMTLNPDGTDK